MTRSAAADFIDHPTPRQVREWQHATIADWVSESLGYRDAVYSAPGPKVGDSYAIFADTWPDMPDGLQWVRNSAARSPSSATARSPARLPRRRT